MAIVERNRAKGYDNVASGTAYGAENPVDGEDTPVAKAVGGGSNIAIGSAYANAGTPHENIAVGVDYGTREQVG